MGSWQVGKFASWQEASWHLAIYQFANLLNMRHKNASEALAL